MKQGWFFCCNLYLYSTIHTFKVYTAYHTSYICMYNRVAVSIKQSNWINFFIDVCFVLMGSVDEKGAKAPHLPAVLTC